MTKILTLSIPDKVIQASIKRANKMTTWREKYIKHKARYLAARDGSTRNVLDDVYSRTSSAIEDQTYYSSTSDE